MQHDAISGHLIRLKLKTGKLLWHYF